MAVFIGGNFSTNTSFLPFHVSIFTKSDCRDSPMSSPQLTGPQSTGLSVLESYRKLQQKPKTVPEFFKKINALRLI